MSLQFTIRALVINHHIVFSYLLAGALFTITGMPLIACAEAITADFNGDGFEDIVSSDPHKTVNGKTNAGAVVVMFTNEYGLYPNNSHFSHRPQLNVQTLTQDSDIHNDRPETNDRFGSSIAVGDFNGDNFDDLAVGAPNDEVNGHMGAVSVFFGSSRGFTKIASELITGGPDVLRYGASLATADFDGDGYDDLAVGSPAHLGNDLSNTSGVWVYYGSHYGFWGPFVQRKRWFSQKTNVAGEWQRGALFGESIATGDIDCNGYPDLLIGEPAYDASPTNIIAGRATIIFFSATSITHSKSIRDYNESYYAGDKFGSSVAVGDFNGDGCDDVVIAHAEEAVGSKVGAGAVTVLNGSSTKRLTNRKLWYQGRRDFHGKAEKYDKFGFALAVGDFNNDGKDDLAIGTPGENTESTWPDRRRTGFVSVLYGTSSGLRISSSRAKSSFLQGRWGVAGGNHAGDQFGYALSSGDYNNDGVADLLIGAPFSHRYYGNQGKIQVITGTTGGLNPISGVTQIFDVTNLPGLRQGNGRIQMGFRLL